MSRATDNELTYCTTCRKYKMGKHFYAFSPGAGPNNKLGERGGVGRGICKQCWNGTFGGDNVRPLNIVPSVAAQQFIADLVTMREEIERISGCR